ncbi:MAG TPA: pyrroloquinoline quinone precursor peptide PqqA [Steroidobacteraceae bacterium]
MIMPYGPLRTRRMMVSPERRHIMKWEVPQATDMRFGMEITMYIANR